jgi:hypothetical protein
VPATNQETSGPRGKVGARCGFASGQSEPGVVLREVVDQLHNQAAQPMPQPHGTKGGQRHQGHAVFSVVVGEEGYGSQPSWAAR